MSLHLEVRTTIRPESSYFRRIHYMAASLMRLGGRLRDFEIVVSVGGNEPRENLYRTQPWSKHYPIIWRWVDPVEYARLGYRATNRDRAWHMSRARHVMMVDSDVIFMREFSDLMRRIEESPAICGVMAHVPPWGVEPGQDPHAWWKRLFEAFGVAPAPHTFEHSGWGSMFDIEPYRYSPAYFNGGMVVGPVELMEEMCMLFSKADDSIAAVGNFVYKAQIARTLAMYKAGVPVRSLPVRYNFPNDRRFERAYPYELDDLRILHYLRCDAIDRNRDFASPSMVRQMLARNDLTGANEKLRGLIASMEWRVASEASRA